MTLNTSLPTPVGQSPANAQFLRQLAQPPVPTAPDARRPRPPVESFEHGLMLKQPRTWSRLILWSLLGATTGGLVWANIAELEEAIPAQGKLEPQGTVKEIQAPNQGVVKTVYVKEGQAVKKGDRLLTIDPTALNAQIHSYKLVRQALAQENRYYTAQMAGYTDRVAPQRVPPAIVSLTRHRMALLAENHYLRAQISGDLTGLSADQQARLQYKQQEENSRWQTAQWQTAQVQRQLQQARLKANHAQQILAINQGILAKIAPLAEQGGISQVQFLKQQQEVMSDRAEVEQLTEEQQRLMAVIQEVSAKSRNTNAVDGRDIMAQVAMNEQRIAEIDSQLTKAILENEKRMAEVDSQVQQLAQMLKRSEIRSPADGVVFELKAKASGYVANVAEPLLKVVPQESLVAKVAITNQDIGFVKPGMEVDVRVESFPLSEFGDIKGKLVWIGSDAAEPTQIQPYYTFPAKVKLQRQVITVKGKPVRLRSGMALSVNIKTRKRKVMDIFTEQFKHGVESLKFVR